MIITSPTGLYRSILPTGESSGNITYTISTQGPPSTNTRAIQLPLSVELSEAPAEIFNDEERREQFGELVYTITTSTRDIAGSNTKLYEVGEILEFEENPPEDVLETVRAPVDLEIRHDTNLLDLSAAGLSEAEIEELTRQSQTKQASLETSYAQKQSDIENYNTQIAENQKKLNETNKAIRATREVYGIADSDLTFDNAIYQKLLANSSSLEQSKTELIVARNAAAVEAREIYESLLRLAELVR